MLLQVEVQDICCLYVSYNAEPYHYNVPIGNTGIHNTLPQRKVPTLMHFYLQRKNKCIAGFWLLSVPSFLGFGRVKYHHLYSHPAAAAG